MHIPRKYFIHFISSVLYKTSKTIVQMTEKLLANNDPGVVSVKWISEEYFPLQRYLSWPICWSISTKCAVLLS